MQYERQGSPQIDKHSARLRNISPEESSYYDRMLKEKNVRI